MKFTHSSELLTIFPEGRIDSSNSDACRAEMTAILSEHPADALMIDIENLTYISSAGLRVLLALRKLTPSMKIVNASPEIYDIFEMTGFTEIIPIEKAYRKLCVDGCEVIGKGANGIVYRYDPDTIIKVYFNPDALPDIHRERELARKAFVLGIPTAISYDVVKVGEGYGSVFELLNAKSLNALIISDPAHIDEYIGMYVDLLKKIHATELKPGEIPSMKEVALRWAGDLKPHLPADQFEKLTSLVSAVPENFHMLHGDYHTKNVMLQNDEVLLIDMDTLCTGHPVFELASVFLAYVGYSEMDHTVVEQFMGLSPETAAYIWHKTLELYFGTTDEKKLREYADKACIIGYTRMLRRTIRREKDTEYGKKTIANCKKRLAELLAQYDTIVF